jgi:hypothetical protein
MGEDRAVGALVNVESREQKLSNYFSDFTIFSAEKRSYRHDGSFLRDPGPFDLHPLIPIPKWV